MIRHILMTSDVTTSEWNYSVEISRALSRHNMRVSLATTGGPLTKEQRREAARVPGLAIYDGGLNPGRPFTSQKDIADARSFLLTLEDRLSPDIVQLNGFGFGAAAFKSPVLLSLHSGVSSLLGDLEERTRSRSEIKSILDSAELVVVPTFANLVLLKEIYNFTTSTKVIPHFRRTSDYCAIAKQKFIYSSGSHSRVSDVVDAMETAASEMNWPVVLDPGPIPSNKATQLSFAGRAQGRLAAANVAQQLSKAAIYCLPTANDLSDVPVLEGALSRCALVVCDLPNLRENWNNCALFVPADDHNALKQSLHLLMVDGGLREDLSLRAYDRAKEFSPERCIDDYLDAYQMAWMNKFRPSLKLIS
jgi:glycogen(starch) synthase